MTNIVKAKHFVHVEGSGAKEDAITAFVNFINDDNVNPIDITHAYQQHPYRTLSIFVVYADVGEASKIVKEAVDESERREKEKANVDKKKTTPKAKAKTKKTNSVKKSSKPS